LDYLAPAFAGDELQLATWIVDCDERFSLTRRFQLVRVKDAKTLLYARTRFACVALSSGRPKRLPDEYRCVYGGAVVSE
ncbi:MAG TPA: acyl-CoA thioesterase, partial [Halomonas sp.]|nr:acyl-CoA thioesterase [Halomonas sp.]